jgi:hypothetical protein
MAANLLDTNLLLLWLVGRTDAQLVYRFKRVQSFDAGDIGLLNRLLGDVPMVTTPHVLAEVSNFVQQAPLDKRTLLAEAFRQFALNHLELYEEAKVLAHNKTFMMYGLAEAGLFDLAGRHHVITVDYRLAGQIQAAGLSATNFNHVRAASYRNGL